MILFEIAFALWMAWGFLQIAINLLKLIGCIVLMPFALVLDLWDNARATAQKDQ